MTRSPFGSIQYVGPDRYRIFYTIGGKRGSKRISGTRDDAVAALARIYGGGAIAPAITWSDYWRRHVEPTFDALSDRTAYDYAMLWRRLEPLLGRRCVRDTTWRHIQQALDSIEAPSVQRYAYRLLKKLGNLAVRDGLLERCPVGRELKLKPLKRQTKRTVALDDVAALLGAVDGYRWSHLVAVELGGGLRHEEACAICAEDVERVEDGGRVYAIVSVSKALTMVNGAKVLKNTKTGGSVREIALGEPFASVALAAPWPRMPEGRALGADDLVSPGIITRSWMSWRRAHGIDAPTFAEMRTCFSMLHAEARTPDVLVSLAMGHADGTTRGAHYTQTSRRAMMLVADCLTDALEVSGR